MQLHEFGEPESVLRRAALPASSLEPADDGVLIRVLACGCNFPDLLITQGKYQAKPNFPFSPGGEVSGVVMAVGANVTTVCPGDHVVAITGSGGFATHVSVPSSVVIQLPRALEDFRVAASLVCTYATTLHALVTRGRIQRGETLLVLGASGGIGTAAIELGRVLGAKVIAAGSHRSLKASQALGSDAVVDYDAEDLKSRVRELTGGRGADVVLDPVGGSYTEEAVRSMAWGGRHLMVGFAAGGIPMLPLNLLLLRSTSSVGVFWGSWAARNPSNFRRHVELLFQWYSEGKINPIISKSYPLVDAAVALRDLAERRVSGKCVLYTPALQQYGTAQSRL